MRHPKGTHTMPTTASITTMCQTVTELVAADMRAANLTVTELSERSGMSRRKLIRRLAGAPLKASELAALGLVLGRRPSEWFRIAESDLSVPGTADTVTR